MDQGTLQVVRAVEAGATTIKGVIDATGLSRLKIERALNALEKQRLLVRDSPGVGGGGAKCPAPPPEMRLVQCLLRHPRSGRRQKAGKPAVQALADRHRVH